MTRIEEADQDLYDDAFYVIGDLRYCEQEIKDYNNNKQEKSLAPDQRFGDIKRIGKMMDKTLGNAAHVLKRINVCKADELHKRTGLYYALAVVIRELIDRITWQMYGDLSEPYDDRNSTFTSDNENTEKEN